MRTYDLAAIARKANGLARAYRGQRRDWDLVGFRPRDVPLPPRPWAYCLREGFRLAWKIAKREAQA